MGKLLPNYGNVTYSSAGQLSPLLNDPTSADHRHRHAHIPGRGAGLRGLGGDAVQDQRPGAERRAHRRRRATLAVIGDLRDMSTEFVRALNLHGYGVIAGRGHRRAHSDPGRGHDEGVSDQATSRSSPRCSTTPSNPGTESRSRRSPTPSCAPAASRSSARRSAPPPFPPTSRPGRWPRR